MAIVRYEQAAWRGALAHKMRRISDWMEGSGGVLIGFSGGVDSTFLAALAFQALGRRALAVTIDSPFLARSELREARELARLIGIRHRVVRLDPLNDVGLAANPPDRCYHCKRLDFSRLFAVARKEGIVCVCDGSNVDDRKDYRPGSRATRELGVCSPLRTFGFTKADIRAASRKLGLPTADKPAMACLASRFPYGVVITRAALKTVERAEATLHALGFRQCRVRLHGDVGRIELDPSDLRRALVRRGAIVDGLRSAGLRYVALDLQGYRMGSLNEGMKFGKTGAYAT